MKLSDVRLNGVGKLNGELFIVVDRYPADRVSGGTEIAFEDGCRKTYIWDYEDPEVAYFGKGKLKTEIVLEEKI
jgi:hypothetical protein